MIKKKYWEPIGLILLLSAFGWQCLEEHSYRSEVEGYIYEFNDKLLHIWDGIYDEALRSDRYMGHAAVAINYDVANLAMKDWQQMKEDFCSLDSQLSFFFWIRAFLYVLGSIFIIGAKWPKTYNDVKEKNS